MSSIEESARSGGRYGRGFVAASRLALVVTATQARLDQLQ